MKLKEILKNNASFQLIGGNPTITGADLKSLIPFFNDIEEFQGKHVEVIESPDNLVTMKGIESLQENIKIQTLFLIDNDVYIRCTVDSIKNA
jgi:hypothetical protein